MKNKKGIFPIILGIINSILLIPLLCMHFPRITDSNLELDYIGIIIGILSLLVTVLIGWNIFYALNMKKEMLDKISQIQKDCQNEIDKIKKNSEEKENELEQLKQENDKILKDLTRKEQEVIANISGEFVVTFLLKELKEPKLKEESDYNLFRHFLNVICYHEYAEQYNDADDYIDTLITVINKTRYNTLSPKHKEDIIKQIRTLKHPDKLTNYMRLSAYICPNDEDKQNTY